MRARVDPDICIGCTLCTQTCPQVFRMEGDKAVVYVSIAPKDAEDALGIEVQNKKIEEAETIARKIADTF